MQHLDARQFLTARPTPSRPEIEQNHFAPETAQRHFSTVQVGQREVICRLVERQGQRGGRRLTFRRVLVSRLRRRRIVREQARVHCIANPHDRIQRLAPQPSACIQRFLANYVPFILDPVCVCHTRLPLNLNNGARHSIEQFMPCDVGRPSNPIDDLAAYQVLLLEASTVLISIGIDCPPRFPIRQIDKRLLPIVSCLDAQLVWREIVALPAPTGRSLTGLPDFSPSPLVVYGQCPVLLRDLPQQGPRRGSRRIILLRYQPLEEPPLPLILVRTPGLILVFMTARDPQSPIGLRDQLHLGSLGTLLPDDHPHAVPQFDCFLPPVTIRNHARYPYMRQQPLAIPPHVHLSRVALSLAEPRPNQQGGQLGGVCIGLAAWRQVRALDGWQNAVAMGGHVVGLGRRNRQSILFRPETPTKANERRYILWYSGIRRDIANPRKGYIRFASALFEQSSRAAFRVLLCNRAVATLRCPPKAFGHYR